MGLFDIFGGNPMDFNNDGKVDLGEAWIGYNIFNECMNEDEDDEDFGEYDDENDDYD